MNTEHPPVSKSLCRPLACHCLSLPQGRTGLHLCLLRIGAGVAAQRLGTAIRTTRHGKAWHRVAWYQHGRWPGTVAGGAPCPQQLPEGANGERTPNGQFTENTVLTQERQKGIFSLADV